MNEDTRLKSDLDITISYKLVLIGGLHMSYRRTLVSKFCKENGARYKKHSIAMIKDV